jgi:hypothetical protein
VHYVIELQAQTSDHTYMAGQALVAGNSLSPRLTSVA